MLHPFKAYFFHTNARHHSLALAETGIDRRLHHLMVETYSLDDVGQGLDLADADDCVSVSLGRHSNDLMTSFYARTPSGFMVEYGWGGRDIAPDAWQPVELRDGPSLWGQRAWLPPEGARGRWPCAWTPRRGRARPGPGVARQSPRHGRRLSLVGCAAPLSRLAAPDGRAGVSARRRFGARPAPRPRRDGCRECRCRRRTR